MTDAPANGLRVRLKHTSSGLAEWLHQESLSVFVSTYQHDCLVILSAPTESGLVWDAYPFDRPMGISVNHQELRLATRQHLWTFRNTASFTSGPDAATVFRLNRVEGTGYLDAHDLVTTQDGQSYVVDTHHSCLREFDSGRTLKPVWQPDFVSDLKPEDRCHFNGVALDEGTPRYATVVSQSDDPEGWRAHRRDGGAVIDITADQLVATGLSMPHSPRVYRDRVWLLNAGTGEFGFLAPQNGAFHPLVACPGFLRGLAFHGDYAVIGVSQSRKNNKFAGLALGDRLEEQNTEAICGLLFVNIESGETAHFLEFEEPLTELFDIQLLSGTRHPTLLKCRQLD